MKASRAKEETGRKFIKYIAYLQVIGIILVVIGHSFHEYPDGENGNSLLAYRLIYSFHMPIFLFASGFLFALTSKNKVQGTDAKSLVTFVWGKIRRIIIPFVFLTLIAFVPRAAMSSMADDKVELTLQSLVDSLIYGDRLVIPFFWFIQVLFILLIASFIYFRLTNALGIKRLSSVLILDAIFILLYFIPIQTSVFSIGEMSRVGIYFTLGVTYCYCSARIDNIIKWNSTAVFMLWIAVWAATFYIGEDTDLALLCATAGIGMSISLARIIEHRKITVLDHLIGANIMIFLLSWFFNVASQQVLSHLVNLPWGCYTIISIITGLYIPWLIFRCLQRHDRTKYGKPIAFLLGHSPARRPAARQS